MTETAATPSACPYYDGRDRDPRAASDAARPAGAVQRGPSGEWIVLGHPEAVRVARDAGTYSSAVSRFLQVPNGLDGGEHAAFRAALDPFFDAARMTEIEPGLREIARGLCVEVAAEVAAADGENTTIDAVGRLGSVFAVRGQCRWLGWPAELEPRLLSWMDANHAASRDGGLERTAAVAAEFDAIIETVLAPRIEGGQIESGRDAATPADVTGALLACRVATPETPDGAAGRPLTRAEVVSVLRNWTGGDLGSIALCVGVVLTGLARRTELQAQIRAGMPRERLVALIDELLRIDDPFVSNRRVATTDTTLGGVEIAAGERVVLHWTSANRDERVFADPDALDPDAHATDNLVWGTGPHVCPGRPLAMLELAVGVEEIVAAFDLAPAAHVSAERELAPVGGWASAPLVLTPSR